MTENRNFDSTANDKRRYKLFSDEDIIPMRPIDVDTSADTIPESNTAHNIPGNNSDEEKDIERGMRILESRRYDWERSGLGSDDSSIPTKKIAALFIVMILFILFIAIMYFISKAFSDFHAARRPSAPQTLVHNQ